MTTPEWTHADRALLLGLEAFEGTLCSGGCGQPQHVAWHADANGHYEGHRWICQACTAAKGEQVVFQMVSKTPSPDVVARFKPFDLLKSTEEPTVKEQ